MPPYYALGIFAGSQSQRWAEKTNVQADLADMLKLNLPIEGLLLDGYTEDSQKPFTTDATKFPFDTLITDLHA